MIDRSHSLRGTTLKKLLLLLFVTALVFLGASATCYARASRPTFNQAINQAVAHGWPQRVDEHLAFMPGTNPQLGFYFAGTWSDDARAAYIAKEARAIGLKNVHLEAVPIDTFTFKSASVQVGAKYMIASTFDGISPTPASGLTAPVVWAHEGTAQDFDALAKAGVSVKGKLVIVDADPNNWWMNDPQAEATYRGAIGVIFTYGPTTAPYWSWAPDELGQLRFQLRPFGRAGRLHLAAGRPVARKPAGRQWRRSRDHDEAD